MSWLGAYVPIGHEKLEKEEPNFYKLSGTCFRYSRKVNQRDNLLEGHTGLDSLAKSRPGFGDSITLGNRYITVCNCYTTLGIHYIA